MAMHVRFPGAWVSQIRTTVIKAASSPLHMWPLSAKYRRCTIGVHTEQTPAVKTVF